MYVIQCWDDGNVDDIRLIDILRKYKAKASFNLNAGLHQASRYTAWKFRDTYEVIKLSLGELRDVYNGFLVANHTLTHPFPTKIDDAALHREIFEGRDALEQIFGHEILGFAYPFGDYNDRVQQMVQSAGHLYARTIGSVDAVLPCDNFMAFHPSCHCMAPNFWDKFNLAKETDNIFYFWGHSYEFCTENDWADFESKIERLSTDPAVEWMDIPGLFRQGN